MFGRLIGKKFSGKSGENNEEADEICGVSVLTEALRLAG